ncbi:aminotransferase class IV [Thermostilla marina]
MPEPIAYLSGRYVPESAMQISVVDAGFVLGAAVTEQLRTFKGRIFCVQQHFERLEKSLRIVFGRPPIDLGELAAVAERVTAENHRLGDPEDDLGVSIFVTPGLYPAYAGGVSAGPTVGVHTYRLPFRLWAEKYATGQHLRTVAVRQVPADCWPPSLKCRSRMHYYLADREASAREPGARALLLDHDDRVTETSTANIVACFGNELRFVSRNRTLLGISEAYVEALARDLGMATCEFDPRVDELLQADELFLTSTPFCLLPVTAIDGRPIGGGKPGPIFTRLISAWSERVGVDIVAQARRFTER